jgi:putative ABC transport system substrate-binding protein
MASYIARRKFLAMLLGVAAAGWPLAARAQQAGKLPTIGFLGASTPATATEWVTAFTQRLRELGWVERGTVAIEYRWAEGKAERFEEIAGEFVRLNVDIIVTYGTPAVVAAKRTTSVIPIVFALAGDPVGSGLVESLARPGGNVTGLSLQQTDSVGKRLDLLREIVPHFRRLAILANVPNASVAIEVREVEASASTLGVDTIKLEIRRAEDIAPAFVALKDRTDALYIPASPLTNTNRIVINKLALDARLPTILLYRELLEGGGLMSYGPPYTDLFRRAAEYVDKIFRGTKPSEIPVEQPVKFELVINLKTARALGLEIPPTLLARADEVIE